MQLRLDYESTASLLECQFSDNIDVGLNEDRTFEDVLIRFTASIIADNQSI